MADRDPWEVYAGPPASIPGPPKVADPLEQDRYDLTKRGVERSDEQFAYQKQRDAEIDRRNQEKEGRLASDKESELRDAVAIVSNLDRARATFNPDYLGLGSSLENFAQTYSPIDVGTPGQRDWWSAFKGTDNIERNKLFGASLSGGEKAAYAATTISPDMRPDEARKNIDRRYEIAKGALGRYRDYLAKSGYNMAAVDALLGDTLSKPAAAQAPAQDERRPQGPIAFNDENKVEDLIDPTQRAVADDLEALFNNGEFATPGEVIAYAKGKGVTPPDMAAVEAAFAARAKGGKVSFAPVPRTRPEAVENAARTTVGDMDAGTPLGIADAVPFAPQIGAAIDSIGLTGGRPNVFNSDAALGDLYRFNRDANNRALEIAQDESPVSFALGQAGTLIAGGLGAARAVPALGRFGAWAGEGSLPAQIVKSAPGEAAYGALYGAGRNPDNPTMGALRNGLGAAGGGALGRGVVGAAASVIAPSAAGLKAVYKAGGSASLGQRAASTGTLAGRAFNAVEEAMQSLPIAGFAIRGVRENARADFERGGFKQALEAIGDDLPESVPLGPQAHAYMQDAFDRGYSETLPKMRAVADEAFEAGTSQIAEQVAGGALDDSSASRFGKLIASNVTRRMTDGQLSGDGLKDAISGLGKVIRSERSKANGDRELASFLEDYVDELKGAASRHSDPADVQRLADLDRGYAIGVRIEDAAAMRGGDPGRFTPTQLDRAVQRNSGGVRSRAYLRGDALLQDYAQEGLSLVDRLPNSGTPDRLLTTQALVGAPALGALGYATPMGAAAAGLATLPYAPGIGRPIVRALTTPRQSQRLNTLAEVMRRNGALGAGVAAPLALPGALNGGQ